MERDSFEKKPPVLNSLTRLRSPKVPGDIVEWKEERINGKYHTGFVVGFLLDQNNPRYTTVCFDAGRRRQMQQGKIGIVLESVHLTTIKVMELAIREGDLVEANWRYRDLCKVASREELVERGMHVPDNEFDWSSVIGVIV